MGDERTMAPGAAPTPFTAAEIRDHCPPGRTTYLRVETLDGPPATTVTRFTSRTSEGGEFDTWIEDADGTPVGDVNHATFLWTDLQGHASFPASITDVGSEIITTELGTFDCHRYIVTRDDGVSTFWFAKGLPGLPILFTTVSNGETVTTATVVRNDMPE